MFRRIYEQAAQNNNLDVYFTSPKQAKGFFVLLDGSKHHFNANSPGLNRPKAIALAKDKYKCGEVLRKAGIYTPRTIMLPGLASKDHENDSDRNIEFLARQTLDILIDKVGFPLFVKPNTGSQGRGVYRADDARSLAHIVTASRRINSETLVQEACTGDEFRVVVLGGQVIMAYQKVPLQIVGDGETTIHDLLVEKIDALRVKRKLKLSPSSKKIDFVLASLGYTRHHILEEGKIVLPVPNGNLAQGAYPIDRPEYIREHFADIFQKVANVLRLPWMGIDFMVGKNGKSYNIIEVNSKPGFGKYAGESPVHKARVADVYSQCVQYANAGKTSPVTAENTLIPIELK